MKFLKKNLFFLLILGLSDEHAIRNQTKAIALNDLPSYPKSCHSSNFSSAPVSYSSSSPSPPSLSNFLSNKNNLPITTFKLQSDLEVGWLRDGVGFLQSTTDDYNYGFQSGQSKSQMNQFDANQKSIINLGIEEIKTFNHFNLPPPMIFKAMAVENRNRLLESIPIDVKNKYELFCWSVWFQNELEIIS